MKSLEVNVELDKIDITVNKLIRNIFPDEDIVIDNKVNMWDLCEQLSNEDFLSLKKNVYFADFLRLFSIGALYDGNPCVDYSVAENNTLNFTRVSKNNSDQKRIEENLLLDSNQILKMSTKLDDLHLPDKFLKLIQRLRNVSVSHNDFTLGNTLEDLVSIPTYYISCLPGVGSSYTEIFEELKLLVKESCENEKLEFKDSSSSIDHMSADFGNMRLSLAKVDKKTIKALEKYARHINVVDMNNHIEEILKFNKKYLFKLSGFGKSIIDKLIELKTLVQNEIELILLGKINYNELESDLIVPKQLNHLSLHRIEQVLLDDIDNYLDKLSDEDSDIIQKRWGFVESKQTLEEIGEKLGVTRERIRQKEAKISSGFISNSRISPPTFWKLLEPHLDLNINNKIDSIFSCFSTEIDFYKFLDLVCKQENLIEYVYPEVEKSILNTYFVENGAPIHFEDIKEYLIDVNLAGVRSVNNAIQYLAYQDIVSIEGEYVWPKQLGKSEASACVLINHKKGLPWLDVAKLVNNNSYSRTPISEDRLDTEGFNLPDYIFLAGKGIYKHTRFIDTENILLDEIFIEFMEYAELNSRDVFHLNECYQFSISLQAYDYYEIRHFVKHFGEDYGLYFDGRSQTDSVGLEQEFKRLTQKDVIIEAMVRNENPLTKPEIANFLKSKSLKHAAFYLDELIDSGEVVQVDRMLYTTPSLAYRNIELDRYIDALDKLLHQHSKAVEPSIFKEELNIQFSKSHSKYFYSSIARLNAQDQGWFRKHNLYSINEIPFRNLNAAFDKFCSMDYTLDENINAITKHVAINRKTIVIAISNWKVTRLKNIES